MKRQEMVRKLALENDHAVNLISCKLEVLDSLNNELGWLQESFATVRQFDKPSSVCFAEWHTKINIISELFRYVNRDLKEEHAILENISKKFLELEEEEIKKAPAVTGAV